MRRLRKKEMKKSHGSYRIHRVLYKIYPLRILIICIGSLLFIFLLGNFRPDVVSVKVAALQSTDESTLHELTFGSEFGSVYTLSAPNVPDIDKAKDSYIKKLARLEEERKKAELLRIRNIKIQKIRHFLHIFQSPMEPYSELLFDSCSKYGEDFCKYFLSIAGVESGMGRINIGCCNAWGWGSYQPSSWTESIPVIADGIATKYYLKGYSSFEKLAYSSYGPGNPEAWIQNLYHFYNQIPDL